MRRLIKKIDWWLAGLCFSRAFSGLIFMTVAAALPVLQREWNISAAAGGSITSGFNFGYAVSLVVCSSLADLVGPKPIFLGSMTAGGLLSLAFAIWSRDYYSGLILYTLVGISFGGTYTTGLMILADHYPVARRGQAMGFFIASTSLGYALSLFMSGLALPRGGYQFAFLLTGLGPFVAAGLAWITLAGTKVQVVKRNHQQKFTQEVLANRPAMLLIGGYIFHNFELLGMWAWTPAFMASVLAAGQAVGAQAAGWGSYLNAAFHMTGLLSSFSMGLWSDRIGRVRVMLLAAGTSTCCSFIFGWSSEWPLVLVIGLGLLYAFSALGDSPVLSAALSEEVEANYLGAALGLRSLVGFAAGAVAPMLFGLVLDLTNPLASARIYHHWGWAYGLLGLSGLLSFSLVGLFGRSKRRKKITSG